MQQTEQLRASLRRVQQSWLETKEVWLDQTARDFEAQHWQALTLEMQQLLSAVELVETVMQEKV